jgi:protein AATF/BFR2
MGRTPPVSRRTRGALAAELAALTNPAPAPAPARAEMLEDDDFDPTGGALARSPADDDSDAGASDSGSPGASEDDGVFRPTREDVAAEREGTERKLRMRASIAQDDAEYVGKSSSRRAMERAWAGDDDEEEEDESDDDEESDGGERRRRRRDDDDDDDGEPSDARLAASARDSEGDDVAALGARPRRGSLDVAARASESDPESDSAASDSEDASLRAELASFRAEEAEANRLARAKSKNVAKGVAVRRQNDAWARALRTRIVLQKSVGVVAKFPTPRYHAAMRSEDDDVAPAMEEAARAAKAALAVLGTLQAALLDANPAVDEARAEEEDPDPEPDSSDPRTKRRRRESATAAFARRNVRAGSSADDVWAALDATYARFAAFRDRSCDRWHRKANVQTGKASSSGGGDDARGAFDRALSEQVASAMRPPDRLLARSRPPRAPRPAEARRTQGGHPPGCPRCRRWGREGRRGGRRPGRSTRTPECLPGTTKGAWRSCTTTRIFTSSRSRNFWSRAAAAAARRVLRRTRRGRRSGGRRWTAARARGGSCGTTCSSRS